jgi:hypothetical protein
MKNERVVDHMTDEEVELRKSYVRKQRKGELDTATDEERAAAVKFSRIAADLREGRDPERTVRSHGRSDCPEHFWARVDQSGGEDACWNWTGVVDGRGIARLKWGAIQAKAHRVAYALTKGVDPAELEGAVNRTCKNRACCNPAHLNGN